MTASTMATAIYDAEIIYQKLQYKELSNVETRILLYPPALQDKDPFGFYTWVDHPGAHHLILDAMNAELKNFIIFNGAPEPMSKEWFRLVKEHRKKSVEEIGKSYLSRIAETMTLIEQLQSLYGENNNGTQ